MRISIVLALLTLGHILVLPVQAQPEANKSLAESVAPAHHPPGEYVAVNGAKLWVENEGFGEPLMLIPGGPGFSHSYFHPYFSVLSNSYHLIYFDPFGRGRSDRAKEPGDYTFSKDVEDVEGLRKALGLKQISLLGHSYGGMVAISYALRFPQSVRKLVLVDSPFSAEMWQANNDNWNLQIKNQFPEVWDKLLAIRDQGILSCTRQYQDVENQIPLGLFYFYDASAAETFGKNLEPQSLDVYCALAGSDADVLIGGYISKLDFRTQLATLKMPVLILTGRFDRIAFPRFSIQFRRYAPQAKFIMLEKSGHLPFVEEPTLTFQALRDFLQQ